MIDKQYTVINNQQEQRFEIHDSGEVAYLEYRFYKNDIALMHTLVPDALAGRGIASALAHYALEWAKADQKPVKVYCSFVSAYLKTHPEYDDIIDKNYR